MFEGYALMPKAVVTFGDRAGDAAREAFAKPKETNSTWSPWGSDNSEPQNIIEDLRRNAIARRALQIRTAAHFGKGVVAYRGELDENGNEKKIIVTDEEVLDFFRINNINLQYSELIQHLEIMGNAFPELILNKKGDKINRINLLDPAYCRWQVMKPNSRRIEAVYYSANWPSPSADEYDIIATFDPLKYEEKRPYSLKKFVYPLYYKEIGSTYYHTAVWDGIRKGGWLGVSNKIPALKLAILKNQISIKYHIEIPDDYFVTRYPNPTYTEAERETKRKEKLVELNTFLTDTENSGKSIATFFFYDKAARKEMPGWKINVIDNKLKDDAYLPDSQASNSEILFGIGIDPVIVGHMPGAQLGSSGSSKREAWWTLVNTLHVSRAVSLQLLDFIRDFNGWDKNIKFGFVDVDTSQTQDQHPSKKEEIIQ